MIPTPEYLPWRDPLSLFEPLRDEPFALLLNGGGGRFSYICAAPIEVIVCQAGEGAPLDVMSQRLAELPFERPAGAPPFCGGWAGLLGYEFGRALLPKLDVGPERGKWPDLAFGLYDQVIAFDHDQQEASYWCWNWKDTEARNLLEMVSTRQERAPAPCGLLSMDQPIARVEQEVYEERVQRVVDYVHAGDCFQANLSQAFDFQLRETTHPLQVAQRLDRQSVAPFSAYFRLEGLALVSNSPERFLAVSHCDDGDLAVSAEPIKGTRKRGKTSAADDRLAAELLASEKDRAENLMIVDLMRNDISRVCRPGTVKVPYLFQLRSFANVHHLVSEVTGRLAPGKNAFDLLRATFPGGSITGAPKIRAMQIIAELEEAARGPYCGSLAWIAPDGLMDASILIRTIAFEQDVNGWSGSFRSGGGIVADSQPVEEYQETLHKAQALMGALVE